MVAVQNVPVSILCTQSKSKYKSRLDKFNVFFRIRKSFQEEEIPKRKEEEKVIMTFGIVLYALRVTH